MFTLEQWSVCSALKGCDTYIPPEAQRIAVQARKSDRPGFEDGITTSRIVGIAGRVITTRSGTQYRLGEPDPDYVQWCRDKGLHDPTSKNEPIRLME